VCTKVRHKFGLRGGAVLIYKYVGAESPEEIVQILKYFIEDCSIKASSPRTFNDPSELKVEYDFEAPDNVVRERYFSDNPDSGDESFKNWFNSIDSHSKWYVAYKNRQSMLNTVGVICFTSAPNNYLMWSHYAKNHTGFCIGFDDEIITSLDETLFSHEVKYQNEVPAFRYFYDSIGDFNKAALCTKSKNWEYEKEFRVITQGNGIRTFNKSLVKEVIIGCRAPKELENYAISCLDQNISFSKMIDHPKKYELINEPIIRDRYVESSAF
jgi:hypothetical protein